MGNSADITRPLDISDFTGRHRLIYAVSLSGHLLDGFAVSLTGVVAPGVAGDFRLAGQEVGFFNSVLFAGMLLGAALAGVASDRLGRRRPLILAHVVAALFSLGAACAWSFPALLVARGGQGIALGAEIAVVLPYLTEFMPARLRGPRIAMASAVWLLGIPAASLTGVLLVPAFSWRAVFVVGALPLVVAAVMTATIPESVRFLLRAGDTAQASRIVSELTGAFRPTVDAVAAPRAAEPSSDSRPRALATEGASREGILRGGYLRYTLAIWLMEFCAGAFLYGLSNWLPSILEQQGNGQLKSFTYTALITGAGVVGCLASGKLVNRVGRRRVMAWSFALSALFCALWGVVSSPGAVVAIGSAATFFGSGLAGSTLFVYASEIYPTAARATGLGWAAAWQKVGGLVMPLVVGLIVSLRTSSTTFFMGFALVSLAAALVAFVTTYETRDRPVEQIHRELAFRT